MTVVLNKKVTSNLITVMLVDWFNNNPLSVVESSAFKSNASNTFEWDLMLYIICIVQIEYFNYLRCTVYTHKYSVEYVQIIQYAISVKHIKNVKGAHSNANVEGYKIYIIIH